MAKYEQVKQGMTYAEVETIMGSKGEEVSRSKSGEFEAVMYTWKNATGSNMIAMFQNGKLTTKAQYGLK
jgi:ABC-type cobalt transport system substrate-binding protein